MESFFADLWAPLLGRLSGPFSLRFFLQPSIAALIGIIAGVRDARAGRPAYFVSIFTDSQHRLDRLRECWDAIWKVFLVAFVLDILYGELAHGRIFVVKAAAIATVLAVIPYVIVRGPAQRIASIWIHPPSWR